MGTYSLERYPPLPPHEFCGRKYSFDPVDVAHLFARGVELPDPATVDEGTRH